MAHKVSKFAASLGITAEMCERGAGACKMFGVGETHEEWAEDVLKAALRPSPQNRRYTDTPREERRKIREGAHAPEVGTNGGSDRACRFPRICQGDISRPPNLTTHWLIPDDGHVGN